MDWDVNVEPISPLLRGDVVTLRRGECSCDAVVLLTPSERRFMDHYTGLVHSVDGVTGLDRRDFVSFRAQHVFTVVRA